MTTHLERAVAADNRQRHIRVDDPRADQIMREFRDGKRDHEITDADRAEAARIERGRARVDLVACGHGGDWKRRTAEVIARGRG